MQEFNAPMSKAFLAGLRRETRTPRNSVGLTQCQNMFPREGVLVPSGEVSWPISGVSLWESWPYPHFLLGRGATLLADEQTLYEVSSAWSLTEFDIYDLYAQSSAFTPPSSSYQYHMADFGPFWVLFRPDCTLLRLNQAGMFGEAVQVYGQDEITMNTGTEFHGRMIAGGFNPADYWPVDWDSLLEHWTDQLPYRVDTTTILGQNFVMWTQIGGGDVLSLFSAPAAVSGPLSEDERSLTDMLFMERIRRNEWGFMPMPFSGEVLVVKPLGNTIIVYGTNGIAALYPVNAPYPTFGCKPISDIGILSRGAVGGDDLNHIYIDEGGSLHQITVEGQDQRIGYQEFLSSLSNPIIAFDKHRREYHISDSTSGYILTREGMGESYQRPSSLLYRGSLYGTFYEGSDYSAILVSDVFDLGVRDVKTLTTVEVDVSTDEDVYVALDYRYSKDAAFSRSSWVLLNDEGFARLQVSAVEFRLCLKIDDNVGSQISSINLRWQRPGNRTIRGIYDSTSNA